MDGSAMANDRQKQLVEAMTIKLGGWIPPGYVMPESVASRADEDLPCGPAMTRIEKKLAASERRERDALREVGAEVYLGPDEPQVGVSGKWTRLYDIDVWISPSGVEIGGPDFRQAGGRMIVAHVTPSYRPRPGEWVRMADRHAYQTPSGTIIDAVEVEDFMHDHRLDGADTLRRKNAKLKAELADAKRALSHEIEVGLSMECQCKWLRIELSATKAARRRSIRRWLRSMLDRNEAWTAKRRPFVKGAPA